MRDLTAFGVGTALAVGLAAFAVLPSAGARDVVAQRVETSAVGSSRPADGAPVVPSGMRVPDGWRVETYRDVAFAVPDSWGNTGPVACRGTDVLGPRIPAPAVVRPGPVPAIGCPDVTDPPATTVASGGSFVEVGMLAEDATLENPRIGGDRASFMLAGRGFSVQAAPALRAQILSTFTVTDAGANGCPPQADISPGAQPDGPGLGAVGDVQTVSACRYELDDRQTIITTPCPFAGCGPTTPATDRPAWLTSSVRLEGKKAQEAADALRGAPTGGTPDVTKDCAPEYAHGEEMVIVTITGTQGTTRVFVRYDGCVDLGIDDGHTVRRLTREAVAPVLSGPNQVLSSHMVVGDILMPQTRS